MRKEFSYPYFNGFFTQITFGLGSGVFKDNKDDILKIVDYKRVPDTAFPDLSGRTVELNKDTVKVTRDEKKFPV